MARAAPIGVRWPASRAALRAAALLLLWPAGFGCLPGFRGPVEVWAVGDSQLLTAESPPETENDIFSAGAREIRLTAAINETVSFQLALRSQTPPDGPLLIEVSDLVGPTGTLPAEETVKLYRVRPVRVERFRSWYPGHTGRPALPIAVPDILVPWDAPRGGGPVPLAGSGNELVWVDLHVPPTTDPGSYRGRVTIRHVANATPVFVAALRVRVLPVALPAEPTLPFVCRVDPRDLLAVHLGWPRESAEHTRLLPAAPHHQAALRVVHAAMQLFHEHRANPVLWASFPKYRPVGDGEVSIEWTPYDQLVSGWLDGRAFPDLVGLSCWLIPASLDHPSAEHEGGLTSPRYARLLAAYLAECRRHFAERGWLDRAVLRLVPPADLNETTVRQVRHVGEIVRHSEAGLPLIAHLPARSLRGLGWLDAPEIDVSDVAVWAPPAAWFEPQPMEQQRALGREAWFMPDHPPFSGTLSPAGLPTDARILPWLAYRYDADGLWVEHAAEFGAVGEAWPADWSGHSDCLIYPGAPFGLNDRPVPSVRLKRLRRGLQDHALLRLLERRGRRALARSLAEQVVRWACTDACLNNLLDTKPTGWPHDARPLSLARELVLHELARDFSGDVAAGSELPGSAEWGLLRKQAGPVYVSVEGVRLQPANGKLRATVFCGALNRSDRSLAGQWSLVAPSVGWEAVAPRATTVPPRTRRLTELDLEISSLAYNIDGVHPFDVQFDAELLGIFAARARLAVATCPQIPDPPTVDGDLSDWALASDNAAGDFRLVNARRPGAPGTTDRPTLPTQAFFCMDRERIFMALRCTLADGESPLWRADNLVPVDGAIPWGQDVVEILIDPRPPTPGTSSDIYILQIKPSGVVLAQRGCRTQPPIGTVEPWQSGVTVAMQIRDGVWIVELSLPIAALGPEALNNLIWGFNVTRLDARRGEYSSWSGAQGYCYAPQSLGNLILLRP